MLRFFPWLKVGHNHGIGLKGVKYEYAITCLPILNKSKLSIRHLLKNKRKIMESKSSCIILYPSPGIGHLVSMVELGKLILCHHPDLFSNIIILVTTAPHLNTRTTYPYMNLVSATTPSITFHHLPTTPLPPTYVPSQEGLNFDLQSFNNSNVRQALETISSKPMKIIAFVMDFFCTSASQVSSGLNIPTYYFFTSSASSLSILLYLPIMHQKITTNFKDLNAFVQFPGLPPIFSSDLSEPLLDRNLVEYTYFMELADQIAKSDGIIINTFHSLETRAITAISDGLCIANAPTPPIYCIGPLIAEKQNNIEGNECMLWLNSQPRKSVIFLCFGSMGVFGEEQLKEIGVGLENSGHRFLWVVKAPPPKGDNESNSSIVAPQEPDLNTLLPQGFLERTKGRGLVVKTWAPQVAVLSHESVGGFVTHCGWNSILEGVCAGIPMIGWPLYAEQRINKAILVEEIRVGLGLEESDGRRFVSGVEIEKRVRELMESDSGKNIRRRVEELRDAAKVAMSDENGSSRIALAKLITKWKE
ncbi:Glycosyltransferase [Heracleum sosnowskyi]|uniref:Glycosyltransferase n=1 Tax=Heracleum sosnowskyi TaxID=360622 RepID=A0AAD8HHE1_9APIA|nr:Glycosyltransferase [Heracleum sosnowskyi]